MLPAIASIVLEATGAQSIENSSVIQSLWSGYGHIVRLSLSGGAYPSVILKHIKLPEAGSHPRGWNTGLSHQRKIRSYQVEAYWYQHYAVDCAQDCVVPECLSVKVLENETFLVLTDLNAAGYDARKSSVEARDIQACLAWLASFHATFMGTNMGTNMGTKADGLWECGTYWHLDTRPDELAALSDVSLREAAPLIDQKLRQCRYQTLVHGDAKLANFCFNLNHLTLEFSLADTTLGVAAVDFQYIGRGCGMKDVAYFIGSCLNEQDCEAMESQLLDFYFSVLRHRLAEKGLGVNVLELEREWRDLYPVAWADFHRFIKGWSPDHWKINSYSEKVTKRVIEDLQP